MASKFQNFLPTRVTQTSKKCIEHMITTKQHQRGTLEITLSNHFAVIPETTLKLEKRKPSAPL